METRVPILPALKPKEGNPLIVTMMPLIKFDCDWPARLRDIHLKVWMHRQTDADGHTHKHQLESRPISSPCEPLGSFEMKDNLY